MPPRIVVAFAHAAVDDPGGEDITEGRVLPARHEEGQVALGGGHHPRIRWVDLVVLLEEAFVERLVEELVGKKPLARAVGPLPQIEQHVLHAAHRLFFGDAGVGDPVEVTVEQRLFIGASEVAVVGDADVVVVRHQIEDVLLEVGAGAADAVDLSLADHFGQRQPDLGGGHGARQRQEHPAAVVDVLDIAPGGVDQSGGVEVAVVVGDEFEDVHGAGPLGDLEGLMIPKLLQAV